MCLGAVGDVFANEKSHIGNMFKAFGDSPGKTLEQFALGAEDPLGAKIWSGITGQNLTPEVGQLGGETDAQYAQSRKEGVDTGTSQTLGQIANVVAAVWGGSAAGGALGGAVEGGAGGAEAGVAEGGVASSGADVAGLEAADSAAVASEGAEPALMGAGEASSAGSGAAGTSSSWLDYGKTAAKVLAPTVVSSLLAPKPPKTKAPTAMPDPLAQQQAQQQKLIAQMARRGRASTILTNPGSAGGALGG